MQDLVHRKGVQHRRGLQLLGAKHEHAREQQCPATALVHGDFERHTPHASVTGGGGVAPFCVFHVLATLWRVAVCISARVAHHVRQCALCKNLVDIGGARHGEHKCGLSVVFAVCAQVRNHVIQQVHARADTLALKATKVHMQLVHTRMVVDAALRDVVRQHGQALIAQPLEHRHVLPAQVT
eukprot:301598-Rhodomonas_salina.2